MNSSFEYIDIILLAMIAGFIFLRLRGILGKRTGFEGKTTPQFQEIIKNTKSDLKTKNINQTFDDAAQKDFIKGAQSKPLLSKKIFELFNQALKERSDRGHYSEITFIGINSATIKDHKKTNNILTVTVDFVSEIITCIRDKEKKIISGNPEQIKKIYDTWVFSRDIKSNNPNWQLVDTLT